MKPCWDSSALIQTTLVDGLHDRLKKDGGFRRTHTLTEMFSAMTGKVNIRTDADSAQKSIREIAKHLQFVDLSADEILEGLSAAKARGVRGGRVHDYIHAFAAAKPGAGALLTMDRNDFESLVPGLPVEQV